MSVTIANRPSPQTTVVAVEVHTVGGTADYAVTLTDSDVTVAEVFDALGLTSQATIDGQLIATPATTLASEVLMTGARIGAEDVTIDRDGSTTHVPGADTHVEVAVVAGLDAGRVTQLQPGLYRVGPNPTSDQHGWFLEVDHPHLQAPSSAPWHVHAPSIEAVVGDDLSLVLAKPIDSEPGSTGYVHRPPRSIVPETVEPIELKEAPGPLQDPTPLSWATLLAPIPIALMMALFFRPIFALFAAMGPVMAIGRWYESRRRYRRDSRVRSAQVRELMTAFANDVLIQSTAESRRRWLAQPHIAELWRRARTSSVRLWERRPGSPGYLVVTAGVDVDVMTAQCSGAEPNAEIHGLLEQPVSLPPVPHTIDLAANAGVGVHGARQAALAVARSLVMQLVTLQGPTDLRVGVLASPVAIQEWDWVKWLPHVDSDLLGTGAKAIANRLASMKSDASSLSVIGAPPLVGDVSLVIVDDPHADVAALVRAARVSDQEVRFIVVADLPTQLPAVCSSLVHVVGCAAEIATPELNGQRSSVCPVGIQRSSATAWARSLAPLTDPELTSFAAGSKSTVSLLQVVNFTTAEDLAARWSQRAADTAPTATVGLSDDGPFRVDLTRDGPHCLIAGTTGSGKSELLRSLVLSLAFECPPERLNFVLVDFKGGGAFDVVDRLPHVAGLITDLDEVMVERAITSLRAELHRRETVFRKLGVSSYEEAVGCAPEPMARLVIVIDEFAALATDYGEQMTSVIDLAARGRSLGMHLVLATQRPTGVVDQKIRANTNLRVALRVQDPFDSQDVIGVADAAHIDRALPGRAIFVAGGDTPVEVQTAFSGALDVRAARCEVRRHQLIADSCEPPTAEAERADAATELQVLIEAIGEVSAQRCHVARPLWSAPLPDNLDWIDLGTRELDGTDDGQGVGAHALSLGLADVPEFQTQRPWRWDPDSGALAVYGASAECAAKALVSVGAAFASIGSPTAAHLYVIDGDTGATAPLRELAHTGAHISLTDTDRIDRVVRFFESELASRRSGQAVEPGPRLVLLIDNLASVLSTYDDVRAAALVDRLSSLARDGAPQRIHLVVAARSVRDIGHRFAQQIPNRLVLGLADPSGYLTLGLKTSDVTSLPAMRAIDLATRRLVQLVEPPELSSWCHANVTEPDRLPRPIRSFPDHVDPSTLGPAQIAPSGALDIPVGVEATDLGSASLVLQPGEHALVVAMNGLGRSTVLETIQRQLRQLDIDVIRIDPNRPRLEASEIPRSTPDLAANVCELQHSERSTVVVVDDAERLAGDITKALEDLLAANNPNVRIIAGTTLDFARSIRAWTSPIRSGASGVIIGGCPADGELFKARLSQLDGLGTIAGRGHVIIRGRAYPTQFAGPQHG